MRLDAKVSNTDVEKLYPTVTIKSRGLKFFYKKAPLKFLHELLLSKLYIFFNLHSHSFFLSLFLSLVLLFQMFSKNNINFLLLFLLLL